MLESLFNKVAGPQAWKFTNKRLQHWSFPVKFVKCLINPYFEENVQKTASEQTSK